MKRPDLSTLTQLAGVPDLISDLLSAFRHAPEVFSDPRFLLNLVGVAVDVAAAPDDETRREAIQIAVAKTLREFK